MVGRVDKVEIMSLNVRGLRQDLKRKKIFTWLQKQTIDIILLQETHSTIEIENKWIAEWGGKFYFAHGENNARGTGILIKSNISNTEVHKVISDNEGRYILIDLTINETRFTLCNIYGPNVDNPAFFTEVFDQIDNGWGGAFIAMPRSNT